MYLVVMKMQYPKYLIVSTDSDIPFISCLNYKSITSNNKHIIVKCRSGTPSKYIDLNKLHNLMNTDPEPALSLLRSRPNSIPTPYVFCIFSQSG